MPLLDRVSLLADFYLMLVFNQAGRRHQEMQANL